MSYDLSVSSQIFGSYLHQDWADEFGNEPEAIKAMIEGEARERIDEASREIAALLHSSLTEDELREIMTGHVGCYFEPSSRRMSYRQWLSDVLVQLQ